MKFNYSLFKNNLYQIAETLLFDRELYNPFNIESNQENRDIINELHHLLRMDIENDEDDLISAIDIEIFNL